MAKVIEVIETHDRRGRGTEESPMRLVLQYWSLEGDLLWEKDDWLLRQASDEPGCPPENP